MPRHTTSIAPFSAPAFRFSIKNGKREVARARMYLIQNDLHAFPYAYIEDVFVEPDARGAGLATSLVAQIIAMAKKHLCYKVVADSRHGRPDVHRLYGKLGFRDHGKEFRLDL